MKTDEKHNYRYDYDSDCLSPKDEALMYDNGPDAPAERHSNGAVKGVAWLFGIVAIFAVAILLTWIVGHNSPMSVRGADRQAYIEAQSKKSLQQQLSSANAVKGNMQFAALFVNGNRNGQKIEPASKSVSTAKANQTSAESYDDRIEREAREVIHGDFGDNPGRKAKLGADYAAVQERVNEILE